MLDDTGMTSAGTAREAAPWRGAGTPDAGHVLRIESELRTTLRALAVCAMRASDRDTFAQLSDRARGLATLLADAVEDIEDDGLADQALRSAAQLGAQLMALERLADARMVAASAS